MRLIIVIDSFSQGGSERSTIEIAKYLQASGCKVYWFLLKKGQSGFYEEAHESFRNIHYVKNDKLFGQVFELIEFIEKNNPDIVHSVLWSSNIRCRLAKLISGFVHVESLVNLPFSKVRRRDPSLSLLKIEFYRGLNKLTAKFGVSSFHANSKAVAEHYVEKIGIDVNKISIIKRGRPDIAKSNKDMLKNSMNIAKEKLVFINVGRNEFQKAQDILIEAFLRTKVYSNNKAILLIAGRDGSTTKSLHELVEDYAASRSVCLLGHRSDINDLLQIADIMIFPSRFEGLPGALIEACAAGLPIITTDLPMMHEVVEKDKNALMVPVDNVEELAKAIDRLTADNALMKQFGARSRQIYLEKFQVEHVHQQMLDFYQRVIAEHKK